jgi:hypothetical protein
MSLALNAIEIAFAKSPPPIYSYNDILFYTCIRYKEYDDKYHIACVKGLYKTHSLNTFVVSLPKEKNWWNTHIDMLKQKYNAILYTYPTKA